MPVNRQEVTAPDGFWRRVARGFVFSAVLFAGVLLLQAAGTQPPGLESAIRNAVRRPSSYINARVLAANTAETVTAPTFSGTGGALVVGLFSANCNNWYYSVSGTAAVPAADVTDGGAAGRAPVGLKMAQGATVSVVADATCILTTEWYIAGAP